MEFFSLVFYDTLSALGSNSKAILTLCPRNQMYSYFLVKERASLNKFHYGRNVFVNKS
jgi:hypothetical protein